MMRDGSRHRAGRWPLRLAPARKRGRERCEREMARAARTHGVPLGMLYAVGLAETGRGDSLRPYALNIEGRAVYDIDKARRRCARSRPRARPGPSSSISAACKSTTTSMPATSPRWRTCSTPRERRLRGPLPQRAQGPRGQLDKGGGALSRRAQQRSRAEEIRLPRHRQHGRDRLRPMDAGGERILSAVTLGSPSEQAMIKTGLQGPYRLSFDGVDAAVRQQIGRRLRARPRGCAGALLHQSRRPVGQRHPRPTARLRSARSTLFKYGYSASSQTAFEKECQLFHDISPPGNRLHPARPKGTTWRCPRCQMFGRRA